LGERAAVAELDAVGVDVLTEQRDLHGTLGHERLDLGEDLAGAAVALLAAHARHDAEGARVVAAHGDGHPAGGDRVAAAREGRGEGLERLLDLDLRLRVVPGALEQHGQDVDVVRAEDDVDPRGAADDLAAVLLGEAAAHGDLHARPLRLDGGELAEVAVEARRGVLAHRARVDDHHVGDVGARRRGDVAGTLQESGHVLGVVDVHLAAQRLHDIGGGERLRHACPATESARVSRMTVTLISPGKENSFSMCSAIVCASSATAESRTFSGFTTTRSSRPFAMAKTCATSGRFATSASSASMRST